MLERLLELLTAGKPAVSEAQALIEEALSHSDIREMLRTALRAAYPEGAWVLDVFDDAVVWERPEESGGYKLYRQGYALNDGEVTFLGSPTEVVRRTVYDPVVVEESSDLTSDFIPLVERAVRQDGTVSLKIIQPGWGSSGYYPAEVLKRDGPVAFPVGTKMYWNHPTISEDRERPERDLRDLAAEFVTAARWEENGPAGPGLYADAKVFGPYKEAVDELAPHIGVSIRAAGTATPGKVEERSGLIVQKIAKGRSVDFVTEAGAGGEVLTLFEAARSKVHNVGGYDVDLKEAQDRIKELEAELKEARKAEQAAKDEKRRADEALLLREARDVATETLAGIQLPDVTRKRLAEALAGKPVLKDGALDRPAFEATIKEAAKAELEYLARVTGGGTVRGMGGSSEQTVDAAGLEKAFRDLGLSESAAKIAAVGRD